MEQSYYSADDEIAWGRLTLEEIKKELETQRRSIKGRETDFGLSSYYTPSTTFNDENVSEDKIHNSSLTSGTSAYFTPDESLAPAVGQQNVFLEKLSQAIDCDTITEDLSPQKIVLECNEATNTLMNILDDEEDVDNNILERIQHTLVDDTFHLSPKKSRQSKDFDMSLKENSDGMYSTDDIIIISDESSDYLEEHSYHEISPIRVKKENANDTIQDEITLDETSSSVTKSVSDVDEGDLVTDQICRIVLSDISEHDFSTEERNSDNESSLNDLEEQFKIQTISTNHNLSNASSSFVFNDTMEEIEMALKQGLDYEMPNDKSCSKNSTSEASFFEIPVKPQINKKLKQTPNKYDYVQSPVADYIKKSPVHDNFKLPTRPPKSKVKTPNPKSPLVQSKQFKSIMSPVGVYIKNCPQVLKQNLPVKTVSSLKPSVASDLFKNKQANVAFPEVVYKPGKKIVTCEKKDVVLPSSIQKLVPEPVITKHESRLARPINKCAISKKLLDGDLTSVDSSLLNQSEDISFVKIKQAFIK